MLEPHPYAITGIKVTGLFGYIDQDLETTKDQSNQIARLAIFYGENGTGKTTLLRLAFHLLSPRIDRGHKSAIAGIPFQSYSITLNDGTIVEATRDRPRIGGYNFSIKRLRRKTLTHIFETPDNITSIEPYHFSSEFTKALIKISSTFFFISNDRTIEVERNDHTTDPRIRRHERIPSKVFWEEPTQTKKYYARTAEKRQDPDPVGTALSESIERLERWLNIQYRQQTKSGIASSHAIYADVIKRVVSTRIEPKGASLKSLIKSLGYLSERSKIFEVYGISGTIDVEPIIGALQVAKGEQKVYVRDLLAPYIDTVTARFDELQEIYDTIDTFIRQANKFMETKVITFSMEEGIRIYSPRDQRLRPNELSSGEQHFLLILTSAVLAKRQRTIFIIDEPEISLNTTWQRELVSALLAVSKGSDSQFLLASHSVALIQQFQGNVLRLEQESLQEP